MFCRPGLDKWIGQGYLDRHNCSELSKVVDTRTVAVKSIRRVIWKSRGLYTILLLKNPFPYSMCSRGNKTVNVPIKASCFCRLDTTQASVVMGAGEGRNSRL